MKILSFLLILFTIPAFAQIEAKTQQPKIQGSWQADSNGDRMILKLNSDGSGEFDGEAIKYTTKDNKFILTIVAESQTIVYYFKLQENSLTISGADLDEPIIFSRSETNVQKGK